MENRYKPTDRWAIVIGNKHSSGDPQLHLHKIYDYNQKKLAVDDLQNIKQYYEICFITSIKY